jgi:hypothetical protein
MIENFGETLGTDPKTIPSWSILTNLASHSISMMRELLGSPIGVGYANRSGGVGSGVDGDGVGWWNVVFDYEGFKAHYEVCRFLASFCHFPITFTVFLSPHTSLLVSHASRLLSC